MPVNYTGIFSGVLACCAVLASGGCAVEDGAPETTSSVTQAAVRPSPAFNRLFGSQRRGASQLAAELSLGHDRLCQLQADIVGDGAGNGLGDDDPDDGGWDFTVNSSATEHSTSASPSNTYGATALAFVVRGYERFARSKILGCALDAALGMQAEADVDSPPDFVFWVLMGELFENPGFGELAAARYDAKVSAAGGAQALGESIRDQRHTAGDDGLIAYDLAWLTLAALALDTALPAAGYAADAATYAQILTSDLTSATPLFDINDGSEAFYTDGLSWSLIALDAMGLLKSTRSTLRDLLMSTQLESGAWGYNQDFPDPDLQSTAGALLALQLAGSTAVRPARRAAIGYLLDQQTADGGWDYAPSVEATLANADVLLALGLTNDVPPDPEPASSPRGSTGSALRSSHALATPLD